ncbi:ADP-ribosylglycohydrolase family protein [Micromonospora sp. NBC_01699]|uniref:ADP-ribosylglycohydrolase family protein n=1 Tax=Micromonospora sp. NBC_01699 TaxID=2975984 RepID=UPI002E2C6959|nr:ADP-ribosylglycohydrolase family protein [Micromonospora sp. NBC_01699]
MNAPSRRVDDRLLDRAEGAFLGLAAGDAASFPAMWHRALRLPHLRSLLWTFALDADARKVNKFPLPFTLAADPALLDFGPTDDAEQAAIGAQVLLAVGADPTVDDLFDAWWTRVEPQHAQFWGSVADRSAVTNALLGLRAPTTGNDNPHHYDDSALARVLPVGIRWAGDPGRAAAVARRLAAITNAEVGIDGAAAFAAAVAVAVGGDPLTTAVDAARREITTDSWLGRKLAVAERVLAETGSVFAAVPVWSDEVVNAEYNFGNVVAETLPLALLIARESSSLAEALGAAALLPKQADTMPALVGALVGATLGASALPATWCAPVEELKAVCVPSTRGLRLRELAGALVAARTDPAAAGARPDPADVAPGPAATGEVRRGS